MNFKPSSTRPWPLAALCATLLALGPLVACSRPQATTPEAATAAPLLLGREDVAALSGGTLAQGPVVSGAIQPARRADLRSEVASVVLQVFKENGENVNKGDLLVRLDDTAIRDSLRSAQESVRAVQQALDQSERQLQRLKTLQAQGMTSLQALEDAEVRRNNVQSEWVSAQARLASAQQQLQRTEVRAPFSGVVSDRKVSPGDTAMMGKELLKVIDPASLRFEGSVAADRVHELQLGQAVSYRVNGYPDDRFSGVLKRIDVAANPTTRALEVVVEFQGGKGPRSAGLFAEGHIQTQSRSALMLEESALVRQGDKVYVWALRGAALAKVAVQLGERDVRSGQWAVVAGIKEGERYLRKPISSLREGQKFEMAPNGTTSRAAEAAGSQARFGG
jgi:membrane fusion protein (multidrug efflux system)